MKGEAARTLASATGIECETVAWYLAHTDPEHPPLDSRTVLVIDEASTLHDQALDTLMDMATRAGAAFGSSATPPNTAPSQPAACSASCANNTLRSPPS